MLGGILGKFLDRRRAKTLILAWQNCIFGRRHVFMVAESGLKLSSIKPHVCVHCKASEQVECPLVFGQGWEHDSKGVCCHPNRFILSIVM